MHVFYFTAFSVLYKVNNQLVSIDYKVKMLDHSALELGKNLVLDDI